MVKRQHYLINTAWILVQALLQKALGFGTTWAVARTVGSFGLGQFAVMNTTAVVTYGCLRLGADLGIQVSTAEAHTRPDKGQISEIFVAGIIFFTAIAFVGSGLCFALSGVIANELFGNERLESIVRLAAILFFFQAAGQFLYVAFAGLQEFKGYATIAIASAPVLAALTVLGAFLFGTVGACGGAVAGQAITTTLLAAGLVRVCRQQNIAWTGPFKRRRLAGIIGIGFPYYAGGLLQIPMDYVVQGLMSRTHSLSAIGDLRVTLAVASIIAFIPTALAGPFLSALTQTHADDHTQYWRLLGWNAKFLWIFAVGSVALVGIFWHPIVILGFGTGYRGAANVGYLALFSAPITILLQMVHVSLFAQKRTGKLFLVEGGGALLLGAVALTIVPRLGLQGYLLAQFIATFTVISFVSVHLLRKRTVNRGAFDWIVAAGPLTVVVYAAIVLANTRSLDWSEFAALTAAVLLLLIVASCRWVIGPVERHYLMNAVRTRFGRAASA